MRPENPPVDLRGIVARLAQCAPAEIGPNFSLQRPSLRGSLKKALLVASIRRYLGVECLQAARANTFSELESLLEERLQAPSDGRGAAAPAPLLAAGPPADPGSPACGIDIESIDALPLAQNYAGHEFYQASFSTREIAYCAGQPNPRAHFAARWCAKESLRKCGQAFANESLANIELAHSETGELYFLRHVGAAVRRLPYAVSLSHTETLAAAVVIRLAPAEPSCARALGLAALLLSLLALALSIFLLFQNRLPTP